MQGNSVIQLLKNEQERLGFDRKSSVAAWYNSLTSPNELLTKQIFQFGQEQTFPVQTADPSVEERAGQWVVYAE